MFDVFDTLVHLEEDESRPEPFEVLARWLSYRGLHAAPDHLRELRSELIDLEFDRVGGEHPDIDIRRVYEQLLARLDRSSGADHALASEAALIFRIAATTALWPVEGMRAVLEELCTRVRLGIVSNTQRAYTHWELLACDLAGFFEVIVFSSDVLACKPSPRPFEAALGALRVGADEVVYVGDNPVDDVEGGHAVGIGTVLLDWEGRFGERAAPAVEPLAVVPVRSVAGLPDLLGSLGW